jgi:hypothetical protein
VAVVRLGGVFYTTAPLPPVPPGEIVGAYLTVTRNTGCLDQGQPADPLAHGESNFLEAGTVLHLVAGYSAGERLAYWAPVVSQWLALAPLP